jgi:uncharacterized protein with ParB-like and HNH nuclease domain
MRQVMKINNTTFESGQYYTLADIFSGENKIVIPDLQRDYCWGDKAWDKDKKSHGELVSGFIENLIESFKERKDNDMLTLGLIYGYEHPKHYIQLCDGQQRITTLFLLLGVLTRKTNEEFKKYLISNFELNHDDKEPYLQYAIRESTLYFLSDLVCQYFLKSDGIAVNQIKEQDWYFAEYDLDASIQSMIAAIKTIEKKLSETPDFNYVGFGNFIVNNLQMLYYDMGDRQHGEETFVVINTTGEPLTATENLKPILLGNIKEEVRKKHSEEWEEREDWFWNNRGEDITSDNGLADFYLWYWQIKRLQEKWYHKDEKEKPIKNVINEEFKSIKGEKSELLDDVHSHFLALAKLIEKCKDVEISKVLKTIDKTEINLFWFRKRQSLHAVLPLITYLKKFEKPTLFYEFIRRIRKNYFDEKRKRGNFVDWRHIIQIIELSSTEDGVLCFETKKHEQDFKNIPNVDLKEWYNENEQKKDVLKKEHKADVELWEDNLDLMGDLTPLWKANESREDTFENMKSIWENFELLYNCYCEGKSKCNSVLSNWVRLYRVLIEDVRIGHINRTSGMDGAWFSRPGITDNTYLNYLKNNKFIMLLNRRDIIGEIKNEIRRILLKEDLIVSKENFSARKHLKTWLLLKTLYAEQNAILLSFWDGYGLASYADCEKNKINPELEFSLGNSICGYAVKYGFGRGNLISYANQKWWGNPIAFDTIINNSISYDEFANRNDQSISHEKIAETDKKIQELIDKFYQS